MQKLPLLRVMTWNVLHRIHAMNWKETPVETFPDERVRIDGIAQLIAQAISAHQLDVVCLQEVSGDVLTKVRSLTGLTVFEHQYPRVPKLRHLDPQKPTPTPLEDPKEYLVTLVLSSHAGAAKRVDSQTFEDDFGKGFLAVSIDRALVINTHVTYGERGKRQLGLLSRTARAATGPAIVLGDINAHVEDVHALLGGGEDDFVISNLVGQRFTRIPAVDKKAHTIDHVAAIRATIASATVLDGAGLSDHNPVVAEVTL